MNPMKLLLVDDSKSARYALRLQLQRHGVVVETAESAETALERIKEDPPDAVFMDHTMPGMNGFEALDIIKANPQTTHIPVVMCTSNEDPEFIAQARRKGALDILSKSTAPDKLPALLVELQQALEEPATAPAPAAAPAAAGVSLNDVVDIARREVDALLEARLEERLRTLLAPMLEEHARPLLTPLIEELDERLTSDALRKVQERVDQLLSGEAGSGVSAGLSEHLTTEVAKKTEEKLAARFESEAERLQRSFIQAQSEQAQFTTHRIVNELMPQVIRQEIEDERENVEKLVRQVIQSAIPDLVDQPAFMRRVLESTEAAALNSAQEAARRQAHEVAESVAIERAGQVADSLMQSTRATIRNVYLAAAGAALAGITAAAAVYFLLA